jgi:hypothetical protein
MARVKRWTPLLLVLVGASCSLAWDDLDPRVEPADTTSSSSSSSSGSSSSSASSSSTGGGAMGGMGGMGGTGIGGAPGGGGSSSATGGMGGAAPVVVSYPATVADCLLTGTADPDLCANTHPVGHMSVDLDVDLLMVGSQVYIRFEPDNQVAGTVISAEIRLTVGSDTAAASTQTGELFRVEPFIRSDLFVDPPPTVVGNLLGMNQGAVVPGDTVVWPLPVSAVQPGTPICLTVKPVNSNGVDYFNLVGATPPELVVTTTP